jgi:hypothetical protein
MRNEMDHVGAGPVSVNRRQIFGDVDHSETTVAGDDRGHALSQIILIQTLGPLGDAGVRMGVQINEARSDDQ